MISEHLVGNTSEYRTHDVDITGASFIPPLTL